MSHPLQRPSLHWMLAAALLAGACAKKAEFAQSQSRRNGTDRGLTKDDDLNNPSDGGQNSSRDPGVDGQPVEIPEEHAPGEHTETPKPKPKSFEKTFAATTYGDQKLTLLPQYGYVSGDLTLARTYAAAAKEFTQATRPYLRQDFDQGSLGDPVEEPFRQNNVGVLDLLIVLDNSTSMREEQVNLANRLEPLLSEIGQTDWRIGLVTTDPKGPCLNAVFSRGDADVAKKFKKAIDDIGITNAESAQNEHGILNAVRGLAHNCRPEGTDRWVREQSNIAVLIVSDEENCGLDDGDVVKPKCIASEYNSHKYLLDYLANNEKRTLGKDAKVYGIFWHPSLSRAQCRTGGSKGTVYAKAVEESGGTWGSICDTDYTKTLKAISKDIAVSLKSQFTLQQTPSKGTLRVSVNGTDWTDKVTLKQKTLTFMEPPPRDALINVSYAVNATPILTDFALSPGAMPDPGTVMVSVTLGGQAVDPGSYAYDAASKTVAFAVAPAPMAKVSVQYREAKGLTDTFAIGPKARLGSVKAALADGTPIGVAYDKARGLVKLAQVPKDGAVVRVSYDEEGEPILAYPFQVPDEGLSSLSAYVKNDPAMAVGVTYADGMVKVPADRFAEGLVLTLRYRDPATRSQSVAAPTEPVANTVSIDFGQNRCQAGDVVYADGRFTTLCALRDNEPVKIAYKYVAAHVSTFTFDGLDDPEAFTWQVWVNDAPATAFQRTGATLAFDPELPRDAKVRVLVTEKRN